jgi:hypothetical protein
MSIWDRSTSPPTLSRGYTLYHSLIRPKRESGLLALLQWSVVALCALLGADLLCLGLFQSQISWRLITFAALFFSGGIYTLGPFLPKPMAGAAAVVGLAGLVLSLICVQLSSGA